MLPTESGEPTDFEGEYCVVLDDEKVIPPGKSWMNLAAPYKPGEHVMPLAMLVTSIFSGRDYHSRAQPRQYVTPDGAKPELISSFSVAGRETKIYQRAGYQLDQPACDVWQKLIELSLEHPAVGGQVWIPFSANELLRAIKRNEDSTSRKWLSRTLTRIKGAQYEILFPDGRLVEFSLLGNIESIVRDDIKYTQGAYVQTEGILKVFAERWTYVSLPQRYSLINKPLAQFMHGLFSAHNSNPRPRLIETIRKLSDNAAMKPHLFLALLIKALADLEAATGWSCRIVEGKVVINKHPVAAIAAPEPVAAIEPEAAPRRQRRRTTEELYQLNLLEATNLILSTMTELDEERYDALFELALPKLGNAQGIRPQYELRLEIASLVMCQRMKSPIMRVIAEQAERELLLAA